MPIPRLTANFALSADGKVSTRGGQASGFGSPADHARLLELRAAADAILVGRTTMEADRMTLGLGGRDDLVAGRVAAGKSPCPARVIACGRRWPSPDHPVFHAVAGPLFLLGDSDLGPHPDFANAEIHRLTASLADSLRALAAREEWRHLHCEGGPRLIRALLEAGWVDTLYLTITPRIFGGASAPPLLPAETRWLASVPWSLIDMDSREGDLFLRYDRRSTGNGTETPAASAAGNPAISRKTTT